MFLALACLCFLFNCVRYLLPPLAAPEKTPPGAPFTTVPKWATALDVFFLDNMRGSSGIYACGSNIPLKKNGMCVLVSN